MKLAGTMLRAPLSLAKMSYDAASGTVIYRSKMHLGLKLVRYCGWYSSRSRGARAAQVAAPGAISGGITEVLSEFARAAPRPPGRS